VRPPPAWVRAFLRASACQMQAFAPRGLANMVYALALLKVLPPPRWAALYVAAVERAADQMEPLGWEMVASAGKLLGWHMPFSWKVTLAMAQRNSGGGGEVDGDGAGGEGQGPRRARQRAAAVPPGGAMGDWVAAAVRGGAPQGRPAVTLRPLQQQQPYM
jgi:hypothetical protein